MEFCFRNNLTEHLNLFVTSVGKRQQLNNEIIYLIELQTLAVVQFMQQFRIYLVGISLKVITDFNVIRTTVTKRDLISRIVRWWLATQGFDFTLEYR